NNNYNWDRGKNIHIGSNRRIKLRDVVFTKVHSTLILCSFKNVYFWHQKLYPHSTSFNFLYLNIHDDKTNGLVRAADPIWQIFSFLYYIKIFVPCCGVKYFHSITSLLTGFMSINVAQADLEYICLTIDSCFSRKYL
ncbi:hypothetical protein HZS_8143, partial [Henneguya salminicola]